MSSLNCACSQAAYASCAPDYCWNRLRTVILAIHWTREVLGPYAQDYKRQLQDGGRLHHLAKAYEIDHEIQDLRIAINRRYEATEQLKRLCTKKRLSLLEAEEDVRKKEAQVDFNKGLLTLHIYCDKGASVLNARRKVLNAFAHGVEMRRRVLLMDISKILHMVVPSTNTMTAFFPEWHVCDKELQRLFLEEVCASDCHPCE
ncbi:unnamed protein product [Cylicocyclus nassatus]|uniref:Uncharacterized protein n=1 Tax=Cylicocyclus nassatus TaxID=53992 RepID=A0AA36MDD0_CYLNA|nr:unnamed protein product [Cylicocyclus nassatus]